MTKKIRILNIDVLNISIKALLDELHEGVLFTLNADHLVKLQKDKAFFNAYRSATHVVVDSQIVFLAMKCLGIGPCEKISGSDFLPAFCYHHRKNEETKLFLLGSKGGVPQVAMRDINSRIGRAIVIGAHSPSMGFDTNEDESTQILELINKSGANVLIVGVGSAIGEKWIFKYKQGLPGIRLYMSVGATIDFEAGTVSRAPQWVRLIGFEWMYRLYKEPQRLWRCYLVEDLVFFGLITKQMLRIYRDPWN
jgi:exopolysaccharide biosynthesis WecB/TagA/CpsF family protein